MEDDLGWILKLFWLPLVFNHVAPPIAQPVQYALAFLRASKSLICPSALFLFSFAPPVLEHDHARKGIAGKRAEDVDLVALHVELEAGDLSADTDERAVGD